MREEVKRHIPSTVFMVRFHSISLTRADALRCAKNSSVHYLRCMLMLCPVVGMETGTSVGIEAGVDSVGLECQRVSSYLANTSASSVNGFGRAPGAVLEYT